jgi:quercetin dioxygenase-like cupin family protein
MNVDTTTRKKEYTMRRIVLSFGLVVAFALVLGQGIGLERVNAASPTPDASGIEKQTLGQTQSAVAPGRTLLLAERIFAPGSDSGAHPAPGPAVLFVESGSVRFSVIDGVAIVTKAGTGEQQELNSGESVTLEEYDTVSYDEGVVHDVANPGTESATTIESRLNPTESPATPTS